MKFYRKEVKEMFDNIGGKIKGVAKFITWLGIIASVISFLIIVSIGENELIGLGFILLVVGCIGSWLSSLMLYGFGQLIENTEIIAEKYIPKYSSEDNTPYYKYDPYFKPSESDERTFEQVVNSLDISYESKARLKELQEWYNEDLIDGPNCCDRIRQILADQPKKLVTKIISKL